MITEDYVSFETAKLLKEKGFDEECSCFYNNIDYGTPGLEVDGQLYYKNSALDDEEYATPTQQMAMKWLREKHNLHIGVLITYQYFPRKYEVHIMHTEKHEDIVVNPGTNFNTNEEACESAIRYTLENLI